MVTIKNDPKFVHLYELVVTRKALIVSTLNNFILSLTSNAMTCSSMIPLVEVFLEVNIIKDKPSKEKSPKSSPSTSYFELNDFLGDDWGDL